MVSNTLDHHHHQERNITQHESEPENLLLQGQKITESEPSLEKNKLQVAIMLPENLYQDSTTKILNSESNHIHATLNLLQLVNGNDSREQKTTEEDDHADTVATTNVFKDQTEEEVLDSRKLNTTEKDVHVDTVPTTNVFKDQTEEEVLESNTLQICGDRKRKSVLSEPDLLCELKNSTKKGNTKTTLEVSTQRKYYCSKCSKAFDSHQALGGHVSSHTKLKFQVYNTIDEPKIARKPAKRAKTRKNAKGSGSSHGQQATITANEDICDFDLNEMPNEKDDDGTQSNAAAQYPT